ncbi:MAG: hypothetical protein ACLS4Z_09645 [Christensenellaceae bacterium]
MADAIPAQGKALDVRREAEKYITEEVRTADEAIAGAQDIIAEISDDAATRKNPKFFSITEIASLRQGKRGGGRSENLRNVQGVFRARFEIKSHRVLALNRGEKEGFLKVSIVQTPNLRSELPRPPF